MNNKDMSVLEKGVEDLDHTVAALTAEALQTNKDIVKLTKVLVMLTVITVIAAIIQIFVVWPKKTYCFNSNDGKEQLCEPDYWPFDSQLEYSARAINAQTPS